MFSTGLRAGEAVASNWIDTYKQQKNTNFQGLMAKERASMEESFQQEQRMGDEISQENKLFQDMSGTDVAHLVAQSMVENGINIDNEMYSMIDKVGTFWEDKKQKRLLFEDKRLINDQKVLNYRNQIEVRDAGNARREAVFNRQSTGTWNPSGRRTVTGSREALSGIDDPMVEQSNNLFTPDYNMTPNTGVEGASNDTGYYATTPQGQTEELTQILKKISPKLLSKSYQKTGKPTKSDLALAANKAEESGTSANANAFHTASGRSLRNPKTPKTETKKATKNIPYGAVNENGEHWNGSKWV